MSRRLSKRVGEHIPAWLGKGQLKGVKISILAHLVDSDHRMDAKEAFRAIYKVLSSYSKFLKERLLATPEAAAIRLRQPVLCTQKNFVAAPQISWSKAANPTASSLAPQSTTSSP
ncbi:unnamed protein product [Dibothriocephalus latus]|uniref:Uncharacterized protein n=1 Tax=Dibothriocephalus latus TaxID=60516 RepID=A0A3P7NVU6_DIBLA|nr:unnamed protein product [Dibothriocephalus latus]